MEQFLAFIRKNTQGKKVLFLFLITMFIYAIMLLVTIPALMDYAGGLKPLDMLPLGYSQIYIENLFALLGEEGRHYYLWGQLPLDMIYPGLFAIGYLFVMAYFLEKLHCLKTPFAWVLVLPVLAGSLDYFENFSIIAMLISYTEIPMWLAKVSSLFSVLKSTCTTLYFIGLILVMAMVLIKRIRARKSG